MSVSADENPIDCSTPVRGASENAHAMLSVGKSFNDPAAGQTQPYVCNGSAAVGTSNADAPVLAPPLATAAVVRSMPKMTRAKAAIAKQTLATQTPNPTPADALAPAATATANNNRDAPSKLHPQSSAAEDALVVEQTAVALQIGASKKRSNQNGVTLREAVANTQHDSATVDQSVDDGSRAPGTAKLPSSKPTKRVKKETAVHAATALDTAVAPGVDNTPTAAAVASESKVKELCLKKEAVTDAAVSGDLLEAPLAGATTPAKACARASTVKRPRSMKAEADFDADVAVDGDDATPAKAHDGTINKVTKPCAESVKVDAEADTAAGVDGTTIPTVTGTSGEARKPDAKKAKVRKPVAKKVEVAADINAGTADKVTSSCAKSVEATAEADTAPGGDVATPPTATVASVSKARKPRAKKAEAAVGADTAASGVVATPTTTNDCAPSKARKPRAKKAEAAVVADVAAGGDDATQVTAIVGTAIKVRKPRAKKVVAATSVEAAVGDATAPEGDATVPAVNAEAAAASKVKKPRAKKAAAAVVGAAGHQ